jgi:uncharacterized protein involved in exopolysaccharide biosynthesis
MKKITRAEFKPDSVDLINFIIKHFRVFVITGILAAVISAVISLLLKPQFESTVILYPSSNLVETTTLLGDIEPVATVFGDDDATERLIQILKSEQVKNYLKGKYDLMAHYRIKRDAKYPNTLVEMKMKKYIHSSKTSYGSVKISIRDRDRNMACNMANDMASRVDTIFNALQRETSGKMLSEINKSYDSQLKLVQQYEDSLRRLTDFRDFDPEEAALSLNKASMEAIGAEGKQAKTGLAKQLHPYKNGWPEYLRIYSTLENETKNLSMIRGRYLEALALSRQTLPYTLIIDRAVVAEKKAWPKRSYIVLIATISTLLLLALLLFVTDSVVLHRGQD